VDGVLSLAWNNLLGDPLIYVFTIMQIEFTFSFAGQRVGRVWRVYEALLPTPLILLALTTAGRFSSSASVLVEALAILLAALLLPVLLLVWYRRGNREAGWLILPSLLPAATLASEDVGPAALLEALKRQMLQTEEPGFITCVCARISEEEITIANAGHLAPYRNGEEIVLDSGLPLGVIAEASTPSAHFRSLPATG
jgi:Stage II sporulation protein E (SpoIIE)